MLAHYGVTELDRTPELEEAVFRVFLAQQRSAPDVLLATTLLQRWLTEPCPEPPADQAARDVLDRLVVATQLRFPVVGDLARSVRFRWFDQPLVDAERASVLAGVATRSPPSQPTPRRRTARPGSTRSPPSPSRPSASSRSGWSTACPSGSRCSRCSSSATTATTSCTR